MLMANKTIFRSFLVLAAVFAVSSSAYSAPKKKSESKAPVVKISTTMGDFQVQLDPEKAPISTENFLKYVKAKHYDGTVFHRVIPGFMIQGGGMTKDLQPKSGGMPPVKNEAGNGLKNTTGTIAMARTNIVDSASDQFFINTVDNGFLDHRDETPQGFGYAVFGKVIDGMDVVKKIEKTPTTTKPPLSDVPVETVEIKSVRLVK